MSAPDSVWTRAPTPSSPKGGHEATAGSHAGKWPGNLDDMVANRIEDQLAPGVEAEFTHDVCSVPLSGLDTQIQHRSDLFRALTLGHELHDLTLARGKA